MALRLELAGATLRRGGRLLAEGLSLGFEAGRIAVLAGPNGAGKSTLIACLSGDLEPTPGEVRLGGRPLAAIPLRERARLRAVLRQSSEIAFDFPVADIVELGLRPHGVAPRSAAGRALVGRALEELELAALAARPATRLSGGEAQRVHLARTLVQMRAGQAAGIPGLLLLDEPTTGLDYRHQLALMRLLRQAADEGAAVLVSLHDLPLACRLADRLLLLGEGGLVGDLPPHALRPDAVAALYGIERAEAALLVPGVDAVPLAAAAE